MHEIRIATEKIEMLVTLNDSPTAERIWDALPITSTVKSSLAAVFMSLSNSSWPPDDDSPE